MDYEALRNLPTLNGVTVIGEKALEDYGVIPMNTDEIAEIMLEVYGYLL